MAWLTHPQPEYVHHNKRLQNVHHSDKDGLVRIGKYVMSIDLKEAYFHVPIHLNDNKYLRFRGRRLNLSISVTPLWPFQRASYFHKSCKSNDFFLKITD